jgi:hypothetical protein
MPSRPPALTALLGSFTLLLLAGAWWAVWPKASPATADAASTTALADGAGGANGADGGWESGSRPSAGPPRGGCGPDDPLGRQPTEPRPLVAGASLHATDRVEELVRDLRLLQPSSRFAASETGIVRRLEQFVLDVDAAGQTAAAVAEIERRLQAGPGKPDAPDAPDARAARAAADARDRASMRGVRIERVHAPSLADDEWLSARLLVAVAGLGASEPVLARWGALAPVERADVLLALGWDPLAAPDAARLDARRADDLVRGMPLLPLVLSRAPSPEVLAFLRERLDEPSGGLHGLRVRDACVLLLGVGIGQVPGCLESIERSLRADPTGSFVALFTLTASDDTAARALLTRLRSRSAPSHPVPADDLAAHERFALDLGHALVAVRGEELIDLSALRAGLAPGRDTATRLEHAAGVLARISDGVLQRDTRRTLSDMLVGTLASERERDVIWLELLALRQLHTEEAWLPSRTIGYGAEEQADPARAAERTGTFLAYLADPHPATRRLAVFGLLGTTDARSVEPALAAALAVERDASIAQWMRLALLRL